MVVGGDGFWWVVGGGNGFDIISIFFKIFQARLPAQQPQAHEDQVRGLHIWCLLQSGGDCGGEVQKEEGGEGDQQEQE